VAVSSGGAAPALAADVRDRIAATIGPEFGDAAAMLAGLRERLRTCVRDLAARRGGLRSVLDGGLIDMLKDGRRADAIALCDAALESAKAAGGEPDRCTR
jgi:siroheme synthase-like protein